MQLQRFVVLILSCFLTLFFICLFGKSENNIIMEIPSEKIIINADPPAPAQPPARVQFQSVETKSSSRQNGDLTRSQPVEIPSRCTNAARRQFLQRYCAGTKPYKPIGKEEMRLTFRRLFFSDRNKIMFCAIPKTGISSWKKLMMQLGSKSSVDMDTGIHNLTTLAEHGVKVFTKVYKEEERRYKLKNYHKILVVRHPVLRLISAYKDKFFDVLYSERHNEHIIEAYRTGPVDPFSPYVNRPTWLEFMHFVLEHEKSQADVHWMRYNSLCQPCVHRYDTIIKLETIDDDVRDFFRHFKGNYSFGHMNPSSGQEGKTLDDYMNELPKDMWQKLVDFYSLDMALFGYGVDMNRGRLFCDYSKVPLPRRLVESTSSYDDEDDVIVPSCC